MSYKPLISKIRCHNPNLRSARHANRANLHYIATREGVDHSEISDQKQDDTMYHHASDEEYTRYMAKRPRSHGLFGNIDTNDLKSIEEMVYDTSKCGKNIYRGIISLSEQDAQELGYVDSKTWYLKLTSIMPDIANELGISPTNFTWIGAFHAEPTHPHVHYQIWDNTEKVKSSFIHTSVQKRCRALIEKSFFSEEYERTLQAVFESERDELYTLKNESRDNITDYFKEVMGIVHVPGLQHTDLPEKIPEAQLRNIAAHLEDLQEILPSSGRMNYQFMPPEIKTKIDAISDIVFKQPEMRTALSQYLQTANQIHQISTPGYSIKAQDNAKKEIYRRAGNIILKNMTSFLSEQEYAETSSENSFSEKIIHSEPPIDETAYDDFTYETNDFSEDSTPHMDWNPQYKEAMILLYEQKDFTNAIRLLHSEAEQGNVLAFAELGKIYSHGIGIDEDPEKAALYYQKAFAGFLHINSIKPTGYCSYRLGKLCEAGLGTEQNLFAASHYYTLAAADGKRPYAEYSLGKLYLSNVDEFCQDGTYDSDTILKVAEKYLKNAADKGFPYAAYEYAKLHANDPDISNRYYSMAYDDFKNLLSSREDDNLLYRLGKMTLDGKGTLPDVNAAVEYFQKAGELNNVYAKLALAKIQLSDNYTEYKNIDNALELLNSLTKSDNVDAQYTLGKFLLSTELSEYRNIPKAIELLSASADQGNQFAQLKLGIIYLFGKYSIPKDEELGKKYLNASADQGNTYAKDILQNYEFLHSPMYIMANLLYRGIFSSLSGKTKQQQQHLQDLKWDLSKQARKEKQKENEIT